MKKHGLLCIAAGLAILCSGGPVAAALLYDMEGAPPPSGFGPNGLINISQDTIGATQGLNSMRVEIPGPPLSPTFVGALTGIAPAALSNAGSILLDLTINAGEEYAGAGFADMGITVYGYKGAVFGLPSQFAAYYSLAPLTAGTYTDVQFDLDNSLHYPGKSLKQILADGDFDGVTGFQLYFNQTGDSPVIAYIDNIRTIPAPEPATALLLGIGAIAFGLVARRRR